MVNNQHTSNNSIHLLICSGLFYPSYLGGPANTLYWLSKSLVKEDVNVSVVVTNRAVDSNRAPKNQWIDLDGIRVRYCSGGKKIPWRLIYHASKAMKTCDIVMLSSLFFAPNIFIALLARLNNKPIIWSPRGELFEHAINGNKQKRIYIRLIKLIFAKSVYFHATSEEEKESITSSLGEHAKIVLIPNYLEIPSLEDRFELNKYFLFVGRIAPIKALEKLLKGLSLSRQFLDSSYIFKIAGGTQKQFINYYNYLLQLVKDYHLQDKVLFLGPIEGKQKFDMFANARFAFLVSESENFGNVVLESLSQGTPVIASKGTPWYDLEVKGAGFWIDNSPEIIAQYIDKIILQSDLEYNTMRTNALNYSKEFDVYANSNRWIDLLKQIANK